MMEVVSADTGEVIQSHTPAVRPPATGTVVPYSPISSISTTVADPNTVILSAMRASSALMEAIRSKRTEPVIIGGERYIEVDEWQIVARFYGCSTTILSTTYVSYGGVIGFEAVAALIDMHGREIGRAESMCLSDEERWSSQPKKEWAYCLAGTGDEDDCSRHEHSVEDPGKDLLIWIDNPAKPGRKKPKRARIITGDARVPLFQLRSMAQTRAAGKVCRLNFGFVPALAGFKSTPAEEMEESKQRGRKGEVVEEEDQKPTSATKTVAVANGNSGTAVDPRIAELKRRQELHKQQAVLASQQAASQQQQQPASQQQPAAQTLPEAVSEVADQVTSAVGTQPAVGEEPESQQDSQGQAATSEAAEPGPTPEPVRARVQSLKPGAKGRSADGPWQLYNVMFVEKVEATDGVEIRQATTVSEPIAHALLAAAEAETFVDVVVIPGTRKGTYVVASADGVGNS